MLNLIINPIANYLNIFFQFNPLDSKKQNPIEIQPTDKRSVSDINRPNTVDTQVNRIETPSCEIEEPLSMKNQDGISAIDLKPSNSSSGETDFSTEAKEPDAKVEDFKTVDDISSADINTASPSCPLRLLRLVLKKTALEKLFENCVDDPRHGECTYPCSSLLLEATLIHLLRFPSRHGFHDEAKLSRRFIENISKLANTKSIPCAKTFEDCFMQIDSCGLEEVLPAVFRWLLRSKFFQLHPEFSAGLSPKDHSLLVGIDAQVIHSYTAKSQHPCEQCPYCLKRTRGETTWYCHSNVVLSIIGSKGFQMPLFSYRIRNQQELEKCSEETFKQQCELTALPILLKRFRHEFPRLSATLLLDSLYANGTVMSLAEIYRLNYIIVRKEGSLQSLNPEVIKLKKWVPLVTQTVLSGQWEKEQEASVFRNFTHQGHPFTLIDFTEHCQRVASSRFAKVTSKTVHWQWITNKHFKNKTTFKVVEQGRSRWHLENFFNTIQHRGFSMLHDFSRHFKSQDVWQLLILIAFAISMLMELSRLGHLSRGSVSIVNWIKHLFALLAAGSLEPWDQSLPEQLRFDSS